MVGVILCSKARFFSAASTRSISAIRMSAARVSWTLRQVSSTSEEVMPWCTKRASGPTISARWVRKAMTSCLVSRSISSIRATSKVGILGLGPDRLRGFLRDHAELGQRVRRMRLDLEPDLEARLRLPDRGHFRAGIAGDHRELRARWAGRKRRSRPMFFTPCFSRSGCGRPPVRAETVENGRARRAERRPSGGYRLVSPHSTARRTSWASVRRPVLVLIR